jgi:hypothetical protein
MSSGPKGTGSSFSPRPPPKAFLNVDAPGMLHLGICLRTWRSTKFTMEAARPAEQITDARDQHPLQIRMRQHLLQHVREILDDDDDLGPGIGQLMLELAGGVQRIGVDDHHAGAQHAEQRDRILQDIRHHESDAVALDQSGFLLQPGRERAAELVELRIAQGRAHVGERRRVPVGGTGLVENVPQRGIAIGVNVRRHPGWVLIQPISIQASTPRFRSACIASVNDASNEQRE